MLTFDLQEVRNFTLGLVARLESVDPQARSRLADPEAAARLAKSCDEFVSELKNWALEVFAGRTPFDPDVERQWIEAGRELQGRAVAALEAARAEGGPDPRVDALAEAVRQFERLFTDWISPRRAVGPAARNGIPPESFRANDVARRLAELPPGDATADESGLGR